MLITARLTIGGAEVPVAGFRFENPPGVLGASLTVALARPELTQAPAGASIKFELGIAPDADTAYSYVTIVDGGKLMGQDFALQWIASASGGKPGDTLQISGITPIADRWNKAPARPIIMYNPQYVDGANLGADSQDSIIDLVTGASILPVLEPVENLNLWQALSRAYTKSMPMLSAAHVTTELQAESNSIGAGCGFDKVVTNLPNFPVDRVDFTLEGGFHAGVAGLTSIFEPIYFEDRNILYILAPDRGLPAGFAPRQLGLSCVMRTQTTRQPSEIINVIVLSYNLPNTSGAGGSTAGLIPSIRLVDEDPIETAGGRTRVEVTRRLVDWKDLSTGGVVFTNEESTETRTYTIRNGEPTLVSQETLETDYQFNGRLKAGHTRTVLATYPDPAKPTSADDTTPLDSFGEVLVETNRIDWRTDYSSPEDSVMLRSVTEVSGLVLVEPDTPKDNYTPILDAARTPGLIVADGSQSTDRRAIKTTIEQLYESGLNQAQIVTTIVDELKEISQTPPPVVSRTGSRSTSLGSRGRGRNSRVIRERIIDPVSITTYGIRRAAPLDVGYLDPTEARKEAKRRLARLSKGGRRSVSIELPGVDLSLRRGSIVRPPLRSGFDTDFIVIGFTITGRALGTSNARIDQLLNAIELI